MKGTRFYHLREALASFRSSRLASFLSIGTIGVALFIFGGFLLLYVNLEALVARWGEAVQVTAYLEDAVSDQQAADLKKRVAHHPGVARVDYRSKGQALEAFRRELRDAHSILEGLGENPLPASLDIRLKPDARSPRAVEALAAFLKPLPGVEDVQYAQAWIANLSTAISALQLVGWGVGGALAVAVMFIVSNTIKLTVLTRRDEVAVLQLIGATSGFIRAPFLIEGMLQGILGAGLALGSLYGLYALADAKLADVASGILGGIQPVFIPPAAMAGIMLAGGILGWLGSLLAVGRILQPLDETWEGR